MRSFTEQLAQYKEVTSDNSADNLSFGTRNMNNATRARISPYDWDFMEKTGAAIDTVASQQFYQLPADYGLMRTLTVTLSSTVWPVQEAVSTEFWNKLNWTTYASDYANFFYIQNGRVGLYPTPSTSGNDIIVNYKKKVIDLTTADYTTGTISITSGATAVTGAGTTFTAAMVGRYLKTTDGFWYEIASYTNATSIALVKPYMGTTVAGGTYTIGQMSIFPDGYEDIPVFDAAAVYFTMKQDATAAKMWKQMADDLYSAMRGDHSTKSTSVRIGSQRAGTTNPNLFISY